jgi:hypothetical protein
VCRRGKPASGTKLADSFYEATAQDGPPLLTLRSDVFLSLDRPRFLHCNVEASDLIDCGDKLHADDGFLSFTVHTWE